MDVTPKAVFEGRRAWMRRAGAVLGGAAAVGATAWLGWRRFGPAPPARMPPVPPDILAAYPGSPTEFAASPQTDRTVAATYNNFFEFSEDKEGIADAARGFVHRPWTLEVSGEVRRPRRFDVDELVRRFGLEQRVYRHRCVEAWAMVVPWSGFSLASLLRLVEPLSHARFVRFESFHAPRQAPNQRGYRFPWPYHEGLRLDEAMHPLSFIATGIYGEPLPAQHGAPIRLVVPWKYGFKSAKSIARIELTRAQPRTFWNTVAPAEYDFLGNVNPHVPHPRWSQASERVLGSDTLQQTLLMNGYVEEVAALYRS